VRRRATRWWEAGEPGLALLGVPTMRATENRRRVERLSTLVDELIRDPDGQPPAIDPVDDGLLETARRLVQLPQILGPVHPALEQRVLRAIRPETRQEPEKEVPRRELPGTSKRSRRFRPGWVVAGLVTMVLVAAVLTPFGQTAVASFMAVFRLGRTEVSITPVDGPGTRFEEAQSALPATAAVGTPPCGNDCR
jgi:hypothetical protein